MNALFQKSLFLFKKVIWRGKRLSQPCYLLITYVGYVKADVCNTMGLELTKSVRWEQIIHFGYELYGIIYTSSLQEVSTYLYVFIRLECEQKVQIYSKNRDKNRDRSMKLSNLKIQILLRRADWSIEIEKGSSEPGHQNCA